MSLFELWHSGTSSCTPNPPFSWWLILSKNHHQRMMLTCARATIKTVSPGVVHNYSIRVNCCRAPDSNVENVVAQCLFLSLLTEKRIIMLGQKTNYILCNVKCLIPRLPVIRVPRCARVIGGVLVDEWKDTRKTSVTNGLARDWKDTCKWSRS